MKKLTRIKLINWHRFTNCTIDFGKSTLISGENGAGKSTILDAIQFVILCSANSFNKAAHEHGKRKLTGYIRCKTGRENRPYERTGELSAHVALEFYEESKDRYFIIGAVVDSATEGQETTVRYLIDDKQLTEDMFIRDNRVRSIAEFRNFTNGIKLWCQTSAEARKMVKSRLGRMEDKFFQLVPKALAFRPIDDIKDFVYSYVLDAKEVNIEVLRENVRAYQDLEMMLKSVKKQIRQLDQIEKLHDQVQEYSEKDRMYEYIENKAKLEIIQEHLLRIEEEKKQKEYELQQTKRSQRMVTQEREEKQEMETNLRVELKNNQEFIALEEQKKRLQALKEDEEKYAKGKRELKQSLIKALDQIIQLKEVDSVDNLLMKYHQMLKTIDTLPDFVDFRQTLEQVLTYKQEKTEIMQGNLGETRGKLSACQMQKEELNRKIEKLEKKKLTYPEAVNRLLEAMKEEFARIGREADPHVLCELLEIEDEQWRKAVEGYLNTQRFYLLVEPENFDIALGIYDKLRKERKAYGVGLINVQKLEEYQKAQEGTLAEMVSSKNKYAKQYCNMILGKVHRCERYEELKKYPISITKECMRYQNHVASAIKPDVFSVPFIGSNAFKVQLAQAKEEREHLEEKIATLQETEQKQMRTIKALTTVADTDIKYRLEDLINLRIVQKAIVACEENIENLKNNSTVIEKQIRLEGLEKERKLLDEQIQKISSKMGEIGAQIRAGEVEQEREIMLRRQQEGVVSRLQIEAKERLPIWKQEYQKLIVNQNIAKLQNDCEGIRRKNIEKREKIKGQMIDAMTQYKMDHNFGAAANMEGFPEFEAVYQRLRTSELLEYEEKVDRARGRAEEEFREQFLAKLQENVKQAQTEFKNLNKALKDIQFSNERYEFLFMPSKKYRSYYEMLMDDFNVITGESIFSGTFHETHKEVIEELFERLALNNENSTKTLEEFTDYRTYMDYDIKIIHSDGSHSYYSKVCEEKSGGETQTPFYVTVAASFVQLYRNNIGGEAIGLVMFDEAFNNMDDERIGGVLEFLNRLPLQIIIAAPPDKIQYIGPGMEETLLVMTDEKTSYVEEYRNFGSLREKEIEQAYILPE